MTKCQRSHGWRGLVYWDNQLHSSHSLCTSLSLLWHKSHWPFFCEVLMLVLSCVDTQTHYERGIYISGTTFSACPFLSNLCILCPNSPYCPPNEIIRGMEKVIFYLFLPYDCSHNVLWAIYFLHTWDLKKYHTPGQDKFLAIFYTILTPSFNLVIYSFRIKMF